MRTARSLPYGGLPKWDSPVMWPVVHAGTEDPPPTPCEQNNTQV